MKKVLLSIMMCFLLVGCGNTLTCTMEEEGEGTAKVKVKFKDDKATEMKMTVKFENKDDAKQMCDLYESFGDEETKVKCSGKKVTISSEEDLPDGTKEEVKKELEEDGYKCK